MTVIDFCRRWLWIAASFTTSINLADSCDELLELLSRCVTIPAALVCHFSICDRAMFLLPCAHDSLEFRDTLRSGRGVVSGFGRHEMKAMPRIGLPSAGEP